MRVLVVEDEQVLADAIADGEADITMVFVRAAQLSPAEALLSG